MKEKKGGGGGQFPLDGEREVERYFYFYFSLRFFLRFMKIGPQVFVGTEGKVDLHDESYA